MRYLSFSSVEFAHRAVVSSVILIAGALFFSTTARAGLTADTERNQERLATYVGMFNELAERRRKVVYTEYPVSPYRGVIHNFVHVGDGTAAFARSDLIVDAAMPIVIRRAYHSDRQKSRRFGNSGWRLTVAERIVDSPRGGYVYRYGNGARLAFAKDGSFKRSADAFFTDVIALRVVDDDELRVRTRTGLTKHFRRAGTHFNVVRVEDANGNALSFSYIAGQLDRIVSGDGRSVVFKYDAQSRLSSVSDSTGRSVLYAYDENGRLEAVTDVRDQVWKYRYSDSARLTDSFTPNGLADLEIAYDDAGRVATLTRNGVVVRYDYTARKTSATDATDQTNEFTASPRGLTTGIRNAAGIETTLILSKTGIPVQLKRNGRPVATAKYGKRKDARPVMMSVADGDTTTSIQFDRLGRVVSQQSGSPMIDTYSVDYVSGLQPASVKRAGGTTRIGYDDNGEMSSFSTSDDETPITLSRQMNEVIVKRGDEASATLYFNHFGQLAEVQPDAGPSAYFDYDPDGFRRLTRISTGGQVNYSYDSGGNLFSTIVSANGQQPQLFTYEMSSVNRLDRISSEGELQAEFEYNALGMPTYSRSSVLVDLTFGYDGVGRLSSIIPEGGEPLIYEYQKGEPSVAIQMDRKTSQIRDQAHEVSDFASRSDVFLSRTQPSGMGFFTYDTSYNELAPNIDVLHWSPDRKARDVIINTRMKSLLAADGPVYEEFAKPSNRYFIPPELWAINCCYCCDSPDEWDCQIP